MKDTVYWLFIRGSVVIFVLFTLNSVGVFGDLYSIFSWWDIMTHTLGGMAIGFFVLALLVRCYVYLPHKHSTILFFSILCAFVFFGWEVYEFYINNAWGGLRFDTLDTVSDIMNDTIGALLAYMWLDRFGPLKQ